MRGAGTAVVGLLCALVGGCASPPDRLAPVTRISPHPPVNTIERHGPGDAALGAAVVKAALDLRGVRYRFGGATPEAGFDCSGLVRYVYERQGVRLPRVAASMAAALPAVDGGEPRVGDLVFFNTRGHRFSHVGIYIGDGRFVHAPSARTGRVIVSSMRGPYWRKRFTGLRRPALEQSI